MLFGFDSRTATLKSVTVIAWCLSWLVAMLVGRYWIAALIILLGGLTFGWLIFRNNHHISS